MGTDASRIDSIHVKRLSSFCKLWGTLKYFHPYLAYRNLNWDSSFVACARDVESSTSSKDYQNAVQRLLMPLADPVTRILNFDSTSNPTEGDVTPRWRFTTDSILVVTIDRYSDLTDMNGAVDKCRSLVKIIPTSRGIVFDCRSPKSLTEDESGNLGYVFRQSGLERNLSSSALRLPGQRAREHFGFTPHAGTTSGDYNSAFYVLDGRIINADQNAIDIPIAFLTNDKGEIPSVALGLHSANKARSSSRGFSMKRLW